MISLGVTLTYRSPKRNQQIVSGQTIKTADICPSPSISLTDISAVDKISRKDYKDGYSHTYWHNALFSSTLMWWKLSLSSLGKLQQIFCQFKFLLSLWKSCFTRQKLRNWMSLIAFSEYPSDIASDQHLQFFLILKVNLCFSIFSAHLLIYGKLQQYLYCKILNSSAIIKELLSIL